MPRTRVIGLLTHALRGQVTDGSTGIHALQQLMGHSSIDTTRRFYLRRGDASQRAVVRLYEKLRAQSVPRKAVAAGNTDARLTPAGLEG